MPYCHQLCQCQPLASLLFEEWALIFAQFASEEVVEYSCVDGWEEGQSQGKGRERLEFRIESGEVPLMSQPCLLSRMKLTVADSSNIDLESCRGLGLLGLLPLTSMNRSRMIDFVTILTNTTPFHSRCSPDCFIAAMLSLLHQLPLSFAFLS